MDNNIIHTTSFNPDIGFYPRCIAVNLSEFPPEFVEALKEPALNPGLRELSIRWMDDNLPNVVINTDDAASHLEDHHPEVAKWFSEIEQQEYQFVFISEDW